MSKHRKNKKKRSKTQKSAQKQCIPLQRGQKDSSEADSEQENETEGSQESGLEGEYRPEELVRDEITVVPSDAYDDIRAFIYNWRFAFFLGVFSSVTIISVTVEGLLSFQYDATLNVSALLLCVLFLVTTESARHALIEYPEFLTYIFKWAGITSYYFVVILSGILLWGNDLSYMSFTNVFWKIAPWICILWMISIISTGITWFITYDRQNTKMVLLDFSSFILKQAAVFCLLLGILSIALSYNGSFLGIYFDDTFRKLMISMCYILIIGVVSGYIALFNERLKWIEYKTVVRWKMFTTKIISPSQTKFHAE